MKNTNCLQYVINGMNDKLFKFAESNEGKALVDFYRKYYFVRENQMKNLVIDYNSYFMVQAAIQIRKMPRTQKSVLKFMRSKHYDKLHQELCKTVNENFQMLFSQLSYEQRGKLIGLFE